LQVQHSYAIASNDFVLRIRSSALGTSNEGQRFFFFGRWISISPNSPTLGIRRIGSTPETWEYYWCIKAIP
jgi:hypothetical protein